MICPEYSQLSPLEQSIYVGKLIHAVQNDSTYFDIAKSLIEYAERDGVFDKVKFHPERKESELINA